MQGDWIHTMYHPMSCMCKHMDQSSKDSDFGRRGVVSGSSDSQHKYVSVWEADCEHSGTLSRDFSNEEGIVCV